MLKQPVTVIWKRETNKSPVADLFLIVYEHQLMTINKNNLDRIDLGYFLLYFFLRLKRCFNRCHKLNALRI